MCAEVTWQDEIHDKDKVTLHQVSHFQKANLVPLPGIVKLGKEEIINYRYTIESWKFETNVVKSSLEKVGDPIEGVWNTYLDVLNECGIDEIEESLEALEKAVEWVMATLEAEIKDLLVLDSEAILFLVIFPARMAARVDENVQMAKKGIKEVASLTIQSLLRAQLTKSPEAEDLMELNGKRLNWEKSVGKASGL